MRNWYKTVSNFYDSIKQIILKKYATNLKTTIFHRSLRISGLLLLSFFNFYFAFLIDIIDNIITYSPYSLYYVTRTSANGSAVSLSRDNLKNFFFFLNPPILLYNQGGGGVRIEKNSSKACYNKCEDNFRSKILRNIDLSEQYLLNNKTNLRTRVLQIIQ